MNRVIMVIGFILLCTAVMGQPYNGPFGLKKGLTYAELKRIDPNIEKVEDSLYLLTVVPKPHKSFSDYYMLISPKTGLCKLIALTPLIDCNSYGTQLKSKYTEIRDALEKRYGTYEEMDYVMSESLWDEPGDFMMGLSEEEIVLAAYWDLSLVSANDEGIERILLQTFATNPYLGGSVRLVYEFDTFTSFAAEMKEQEDSAF